MANRERNVKLTVAKETVAGTPVARTDVIPISGMPTLTKSASKAKDPVIVGNGMATGDVLMSYDVAGGIPLAFRPVAGVGLLLKSLLGTEVAPAQIGAVIRIKYTGSEASCKISASTSADELVSDVGDKGSESGDTNFGTAGTIDLTDPATDTVAELVAVIEAYADYSAELLDGAGAIDAADIIDITTSQGKDKWVLVWFSSADSGVYLHTFTPLLDTTERPTLCLQADGFESDYLYAGCVVDSLSLTAALQGMVEGDVNVMGFTEVDAGGASALVLEEVDPMVFNNGTTSIKGTDYTFIRKFDLEVKNNHQGDLGFGQGSLGRQANLKELFEVTGSLSLRLDSVSELLRPTVFSTDVVSIFVKYKGALIGSSLYETAYIELPYCGLEETSFENNSGIIDIGFNYEAFNPRGTNYDDPISIHILNQDSAEY